jgi:hypothetical protein
LTCRPACCLLHPLKCDGSAKGRGDFEIRWVMDLSGSLWSLVAAHLTERWGISTPVGTLRIHTL